MREKDAGSAVRGAGAPGGVWIAIVVVLGSATLLFPSDAARAGHACGIPEGCDLDGDGVAETPGGALVPHGAGGDQYAGAPVAPGDADDGTNVPFSGGEPGTAEADPAAAEASEATRVLPDTGGPRLALASGAALLVLGCTGGALLAVRCVARSRLC